MTHFAVSKTAVAGFCATVAGMLLVHDLMSPPISTVPDTRITSPQLDGMNATLMSAPLPDPNLYTTISMRPVFFPSRRPPPVLATAQSTPAGPPPITFSLIGVVDAPEQKFGLALESGAAMAIPVHQGSIIDGWTVSSVNNSSIVIQAGHISELIKIAQ